MIIMSTPHKSEDEEGYGDDEDDEEYEEEMEESPRGRGSQQQRRKGPANDWHYADRRRRMRARKSNSMGIAGLVKGAAKVRNEVKEGLGHVSSRGDCGLGLLNQQHVPTMCMCIGS